MHSVASAHAPEFLEVGVTMSQAKVLYLVQAAPGLRMSDLSARLGVSLSTVSGVVDRLVDQGLLNRRDDPADRRHVVLRITDAGTTQLQLIRELNEGQIRTLLSRIDVADLAVIGQALDLLAAAALRQRGRSHPRRLTTRRRTRVSRLTELSVAKRSVTLLLAVGLFLAGISAWGSLKQELLPDIDFPVITVIAPVPGRRRRRRREPGDEADRAIRGERPAALRALLVLGQLDRHRRGPVRVRHRRQGSPVHDRAEPPAGRPARTASRRRSRRSTSTPRR